jgi:hypothetical protein
MTPDEGPTLHDSISSTAFIDPLGRQWTLDIVYPRCAELLCSVASESPEALAAAMRGPDFASFVALNSRGQHGEIGIRDRFLMQWLASDDESVDRARAALIEALAAAPALDEVDMIAAFAACSAFLRAMNRAARG